MVISCAASAREGPVILEFVKDKIKKKASEISKIVELIYR